MSTRYSLLTNATPEADILLKRRWLILAIIAVGVALALVQTLMSPSMKRHVHHPHAKQKHNAFLRELNLPVLPGGGTEE